MKTAIDLNGWARKDHFEFFSRFEEPFFGVTIDIDCTKAWTYCKKQQQSFFLYYLYQSLKAANQTEPFRYGIVDKAPFVFDQVNASPTINRPDGTFGFAYMDYNSNEAEFYKQAAVVIKEVQQSSGLVPSISGQNVIHYSALPWLSFTSISHARCFSFADSSPKISFGKIKEENGLKQMPVAIHVHHALMDGYHVAEFARLFQELMNGEYL